jgi:hypothetical protein
VPAFERSAEPNPKANIANAMMIIFFPIMCVPSVVWAIEPGDDREVAKENGADFFWPRMNTGFARFQRGTIGASRSQLQRSRICCCSHSLRGVITLRLRTARPPSRGLQRGKQRLSYKEEQILLFVEQR